METRHGACRGIQGICVRGSPLLPRALAPRPASLGLESYICHLFIMWTWTNYLILLFLHFNKIQTREGFCEDKMRSPG